MATIKSAPKRSTKSRYRSSALEAPAKGQVSVPVTAKDLRTRRVERSPRFRLLTAARLVTAATELIDPGMRFDPSRIINGTPDLELSARHPFDPAGLIDFYRPARWDSSADLVFMSTLVTGASAGQWEGTVGYAQFAAPADASYLVVGNFSGLDITMHLMGPWGESTAHTSTPQDAGAVTALWNGAQGQKLFFTLHCTGPIMGYLKSVQVFRLT